jgi:ribosomal protein S2
MNKNSKDSQKKPYVLKLYSTKKSKKKLKLKEKNKSFFNLLINLDAFIGDTYLKSHYSQNSFVFANRNNHTIYEASSSYLGLKLALQFLNKQKIKNLIFVGNPDSTSYRCKEMFANYGVQFFQSQSWVPGFISKNTGSIRRVLVIYDPFVNSGAKNEAFRCKLPSVGFLTPYANTDGLDYPVCLNFENCGSFYIALWKSFFFNKIKK